MSGTDRTSVLFVDLFVTAVIGVTWWYRDAEYLRYVILAIGMMSALYAICDVAIDGMIHGKDTGSDASEMARVFNEKKPKVSDSTPNAQDLN